jgi:hypothetical protein
MPLFLQLNLEDLPAPYTDRFGEGLLQLFYCVCEYGAEDWEPFAHKSKLVRVIPAHPSAGAAPPPRDDGLNAPAREIVGWESREDGPAPDDAETLGLACDFKEIEAHGYSYRYTSEALGVDTGWIDPSPDGGHPLYDEAFRPSLGDKLGGWTFWVQYPSYPSCPTCGEAMALVFQIDSENNVPYMFGDVGVGHVTQCPTHKDVVTFSWSCH